MRLLQKRGQNNSAFTIVELIVVIAVIGILAGIVIISYGAWRTTTAQNEVKSDLNGVMSAMESARTFNNGYPTSIPTTFQSSSDVSLVYARGDTNSYCVTATSSSISSVSYYIDTLQGNIIRQGTCPAIITNLVLNPSFEGGTTAGTVSYDGAPITIDTTTAAYGSQSALVTTNTTAYPQGMYWTIANGAASTTYTCSISLKGTAGQAVNISGRSDSVSGYQGEGYGNVNLTLSSSWQRATITFTTPAGATTVYVQYRFNNSISGMQAWGDGVICTQGSSTYNYTDGNSLGWKWIGAINSSASTGPAS